MGKIYVLDTNVLLDDINAISTFEDCTIIIPLIVIEEIDNIKKRMDDAGKSSRHIVRMLDEYRKIGNLHTGVHLKDRNILLKVVSVNQFEIKNIPLELQDFNKADNVILAVALMEKNNSVNDEVVLLTKDINVRIKADFLELKCEDHIKSKNQNQSYLYKGYDVVDVDEDLVDSLYQDGWAYFENDYQPNHYLNLKSPSDSSVLVKVKDKRSIVKVKEQENVFGLRARNLEQHFALDLLFDNNVKLVTLCGSAGSGKTLVTVAAGLQQVIENQSYERLIISRPIQPVGKDIGYLPGTLQEKMEPWIAPIKDNLDALFKSRKNRKDNSYIDLLFKDKKIEIEAITFIRGRSIPNSFIIIDEAQNLSLHELKTIITRVGEGSKVVLTGDLNQIDNNFVDMYTSGLTVAIESFKEYRISGHITMNKGERSELATLASKIL